MADFKRNQTFQTFDGQRQLPGEAVSRGAEEAFISGGSNVGSVERQLPPGRRCLPADGASEIADKLPSKRTQQRHKHAAGQIHLSFWINEDDLVWKLEALRLLDPNVSDQPEKVSDAARTFLETVRIDDVKP